MIKLIKYKLDGTIVDEYDIELNNLNNILGMKVKCSYKNGKKEIGYLCYNSDYYKNNKKDLSKYLELWTLKDFDKTRLDDYYDQEFRKLEVKGLEMVEAIEHSNPRWGTLPSNDFEFYKKNIKKNDDYEKDVCMCPKCKNKLVDIIYGMPGPDILKKVEKKELYLGGCEILVNVSRPVYHCYNCNRSYYKNLRNFELVDNDSYDDIQSNLFFQECVTSQIGEQIIDYGILYGKRALVIIKAGQDGSFTGYQNKYIKMARNINEIYGYSVICCSNPFDGNNPLDDVMKLIKEQFDEEEYKKIYYIGYSNGALIGTWYGNNYNFDKMVLVNGPLMFNFHKTKEGAINFKGTKMTFVYGSEDQSIKYTELLKNIPNKKVKLEIVENEDHHFSKNWEDFYSIPEKYLFDKDDIKVQYNPSKKLKKYIDEYFGKDVIVETKDGKKTCGNFVTYSRPLDSEEICWTIYIDIGGTIIEILDNDIKKMTLNTNSIKEESKDNKFKYIYVEYLDALGDRMYCYTSTEEFEPGDIVVVPRGYNDNEAYAKVITTKYYNPGEEPYPVINLKEIYRKVDKNDINVDKYKNDASVEYDDYDEDDIGPINPHILFYYELKDAHGFLKWHICIFDSDKDNIHIRDIDNKTEAHITISDEDIEKIWEIVNDNIYLINIKKPIVYPDMLDGTQEEIYINIEGLVNKIKCYNLWAFKDEENKSKYVEACFKIINEINTVLRRYELKIIMNEE